MSAPRLDLILCMAGIYRRFREAGYQQPKFLLPWGGRTILDHVLDGLLAGGAFTQVVLVANERDVLHRPDLEQALTRLGRDPRGLVFIGDTRGQAETALIGLAHRERTFGALNNGSPGSSEGPVAFHNIDTVLTGRDWNTVAQQMVGLDGWIDTFTADSPAYSYVALNERGLVTEMVEKQVISRHATSGFYAFSSASCYREAAAQAATSLGEFYISDVYRALLRSGGRIGAGGAGSARDTCILGTPAEYEAACLDTSR